MSEAYGSVVLARSELASISIDYIDAYPEGFELQIAGVATATLPELRRDGEDRGADIFGRHWPMAGEKRDILPSQLLRVGIRFSDGRSATTIGGHDRPPAGPIISPLSGGVSGFGGIASGPVETRFSQGYWISPLPPEGVFSIACEWPALGIPESLTEFDAHTMLDAAQRSQSLFPDSDQVLRDGRSWRLGTERDIAFITPATIDGTAIGGTIPPIYEAYCKVQLPDKNDRSGLVEHEQAVIELLRSDNPKELWWLGYLDTGASDVVFPFAPTVTPFYGRGYVLIEAGPQQALSWRTEGWNLTIPDLLFPPDHPWLLSTGWDDAWTTIGGPERLVNRFLTHPILGPATERVAAT